MSVLMSPNIKRERVQLDKQGNARDPKTNEIVIPAENSFPSAPPLETKKPGPEILDPPPQVETKPSTLAEIKAAMKRLEANLSELNELKKQRIDEMRKELEEAE